MDKETERRLSIINRSIPNEWKKKLMESKDTWGAEKAYLRQGIEKSKRFYGVSDKKKRENARQHLANLESMSTSSDVNEKYAKKIDEFVSGKIIAGIKSGYLKPTKKDRTWARY